MWATHPSRHGPPPPPHHFGAAFEALRNGSFVVDLDARNHGGSLADGTDASGGARRLPGTVIKRPSPTPPAGAVPAGPLPASRVKPPAG
jgi:hypothetical protein